MMTRLRRLAILLLPLLASAPGQGSPLNFDLGDFSTPQPLDRAIKPRMCTMTYLVEDYASNEVFATRMQFTPQDGAVATDGRMPCPVAVSPKVAQAALDGCRDHAAKRTDCVFADMGRGFDSDPQIVNTSESASRCASDHASHVAIACWKGGKFDVCNVGCGESVPVALRSARDRCETKHQKSCPISAVLSVQ